MQLNSNPRATAVGYTSRPPLEALSSHPPTGAGIERQVSGGAQTLRGCLIAGGQNPIPADAGLNHIAVLLREQMGQLAHLGVCNRTQIRRERRTADSRLSTPVIQRQHVRESTTRPLTDPSAESVRKPLIATRLESYPNSDSKGRRG
jgi:hypothetical protein